jgi:hypothetical protein
VFSGLMTMRGMIVWMIFFFSTQPFVKAASQIPSLKLKKFYIKTDIKTTDVA